MPIRHAGSCATDSLSFARERPRRSTTAPFASTPCSEKVLFARSIPSVETGFMGLPLLQGWISQPNPGTWVTSGRGSPLHTSGRTRE
jgi:hypothetical protein